ncbi:DNA polymerase III subunit alpha [Sphingomonas parva]|uniref:Error-prone DNA polymerase n=1 Tax=Sphingomonas parva TaxID=2555898 RepID=A0A4Y8ZQP5_9SPHN|nr:error-prone DNA polymerase [Sphingomonas parva]TFI58350.1 DNA polymerase III subunit alpha [Sphingomonas parva]
MKMYHELQVTSHFSFLRGASGAEELFVAAAALGLPALGIVDRNSVAGIVRAWLAAKATGVRLIAGCRLDLADDTSLLVYPIDRPAWSRLTRLLSIGKARAGKGACALHWGDVEAHQEGLIAIHLPDAADAANALLLQRLVRTFGDRAYQALSLRRRPGDALRLHRLDAQAAAAGATSVACGDILYHVPERRMLQDVMTAIREKCTIDELGFRRERHADRHLKDPEEMARRFAAYPHAVAATAEIARRCTFDLAELRYQYPEEAVIPGLSPQEALEKLSWDAAREKYPGGIPEATERQLTHELGMIKELDYAPYFLTVHSIVRYARSQKILCQGRGSAANSCVCYLLGITSIDPIQHELLFERFVSPERPEPPDIDVDFEHERREEVIQWIYDTYGHHRAALTAVVTRYRARGAVREVGKALGLPEDMTGALSGQVWGWSNEGVEDRHVEELNLDSADPRLALTLELSRQLIGTPRHLSQHPGGFVLTRDRLDDLVPIEPAAMENRRVIEWDKDDIEALGFMKVDVLGLGMLGCMRRAFDLLREHKNVDIGLPDLQNDDETVFRMIQKADTLGVFQIESRAQMAMLPRMKPRRFYDLVIQVAIVRPGPIQGDMVHPYLRRREGREKAEYPRPELRAVLEKTLGVPLFQEQAMKVAIVGAGFTPAEADQLRRAMATFKYTGGVTHFRDKLIEGMVERDYPREFAERTFKQIEGFGSYGFPESHAASFAKIAYASSWMKCHHPDVFCCALLNAQPMGFYAPAQIVHDAREHGVEVRPICINESRWDCTLEELSPPAKRPLPLMGRGWGRVVPETDSESAKSPPPPNLLHQGRGALSANDHLPSRGGSAAGVGSRHAPGLPKRLHPLRLGLRMVRGLSNLHAAQILAARAERPFASIEEVWRRSGVPLAALEKLADADAFAGFGVDRRQALWQVRGLGETPLPLFAALEDREPEVALTPLTAGREVVEDYRAVQLSLRAHPVAFLRPELDRRKVTRCADLAHTKDGRPIEVAGIILIRQRPGSAKGVLFLTIEDETGIANAVLWPDRFEAQRRIVLSASMISIRGVVQREGEIIHVITARMEDMTPLLHSVGQMDFPHRTGPADGAKNGGYDPRERKPALPAPVLSLPNPSAEPEERIRVKSRNFH